jgi:3-oxoacyl-(acyl-carrier-protein) synthase
MAEVGISGLSVTSALGRGGDAQLAGVLSGTAAFAPVRRFGVDARRVQLAATLTDADSLTSELAHALLAAFEQAQLTEADLVETPLLLGVHADADAPRAATPEGRARTALDLAGSTATEAGLSWVHRVYTSACVSGSTALADAATMISQGQADRFVVAAGYLVESDQFALFDAGRTMSVDGVVRPFSMGRRGLLLGDGVAAVVVESRDSIMRRGATELATLVGWGRSGDAYHVCQPHPKGFGLARAVRSALRKGGIDARQLGYINANAAGNDGDAAETAALHLALGEDVAAIPVSSTKSVHGHALEGSALLEFVITVLALRAGKLPVNAGYLGPDPACALDVITEAPRPVATDFAMSVNAAFGGANTALLVRAS